MMTSNKKYLAVFNLNHRTGEMEKKRFEIINEEEKSYPNGPSYVWYTYKTWEKGTAGIMDIELNKAFHNKMHNNVKINLIETEGKEQECTQYAKDLFTEWARELKRDTEDKYKVEMDSVNNCFQTINSFFSSFKTNEKETEDFEK